MKNGSAGIIDIGSNSIKMLVAERAGAGKVQERTHATEETRIGDGIAQRSPRLRPANMDRALRSIHVLLAKMAAYAPDRTAIVATSAVRDAANGREFAERVRAETGVPLIILSGEEEARLIGRGIRSDPALAGINDFYLFDLGGGSMECLAFHHNHVEQAVSLPLGCVRTTERFSPDREQPFPRSAADALRRDIREQLATSGFTFSLPSSAIVVITGGTATNVRFLLWGNQFQELSRMPAVIPTARLEELFAKIAPLPLEARKQVPFLPPSRADVFPAALITLTEVTRLAGTADFRHSIYNLRFGLAAEILDSLEPQLAEEPS